METKGRFLPKYLYSGVSILIKSGFLGVLEINKMTEESDISNIFLYPGELREIDNEGLFKVMMVDGKPGELSIVKSYSTKESKYKEINETHIIEAEMELKEKIRDFGADGGIHKKILPLIVPSTSYIHGRLVYFCSAVPVEKVRKDRF